MPYILTAPNKGMELTASSVRCAPASGSSSCLALGARGAEEKNYRQIPKRPRRILTTGGSFPRRGQAMSAGNSRFPAFPQKGDTVRVRRGTFAGMAGKVLSLTRAGVMPVFCSRSTGDRSSVKSPMQTSNRCPPDKSVVNHDTCGLL